MTTDVIIVGAGSAGCVLARRMLDAGRTVTVLEAGDHDINPVIPLVGRAGELWHSEVDWDYFTVPQPHAAGRRLHLPRGKVLGGSHALNACIWVRGAREDFDDWAAAGNEGWSWDDVLPVFNRIENFSRGASEVHGDEGLLDVVADYELNPVQEAVLEAVQQTGVERTEDYNTGVLDGAAPEQVTMRDGKRLNTWNAYLKPVADSERLTLVTGAWVHELLIEDGAAVGVRYEQDGAVRELRAGTVILAAGALDTPRVLLRSGIGPADELTALGIEVRADLPGVGKNLHDHLLSPVIAATEKPIPAPTDTMGASQVHWWWRSREGLDRPDTQPLVFSIPMYEEWMSGPASGFTIQAGMVNPRSRGSVTLSGPGPHDPIDVDLGALSEDEDVAALVASVKQAREVLTQPALSEWGVTEIYPGPQVRTDDEVEDYVRKTAITYHHQVGTARMGVDEMAVVDPQRLAVRGIRGLHVADASVIPTIPVGNTNAPAILVAEKLAEVLTAE